jgi:hypothetical protein
VRRVRGVPYELPRVGWWWGLFFRDQPKAEQIRLAREFAETQVDLFGVGSPPIHRVFARWLQHLHDGRTVSAREMLVAYLRATRGDPNDLYP